ncbi:MAG: ArsR/SmtB family transcription factor [Thermomicrobiales bacterium]
MNEITSRFNGTEPGSAERVHPQHQEYADDGLLLASDIADDDCDCVHPSAVMAARRALGDAPPAEMMAELFAILGDPTRMRVLTALASGELCVSDLASATGVNRTTVSHQLRVLRSHRMVRRRRDGKTVYYTLDDDHVTSLLEMAAAHAHEDLGVLAGDADRKLA